MGQVPGRVHQPCDADVSVRLQRAIDHWRRYHGIDDLPDAEAATEVHARRTGNDHSGTLSQYNDRLSQATVSQRAGAICLAAGALTIGGALLRWRLHLVETDLQPVATSTSAGMAWVHRW